MKSNAQLLLVSAVLQMIPVTGAFAQEITNEMFLREALKGWAKLEAATFQGSVALRHSDPNGKKTIKCEFRDGKVRFDLAFSGYSPTTIIGNIDDYDAEESTTTPAGPMFAANMLNQEVLEHLRAPFSIYGVPMRKLLADPDFKIVRVSEESKGQVKAMFEYDGDHMREPRKFYSKGWCLVDPKKSWAITRVFLENPKYQSNNNQRPWHPKMESVVEYADDDSGVPWLKRHRKLRPDGADSIVGEILRADGIPVPLERFAPSNMGWPQRLHDMVESIANMRFIRWWIAGALLASVAFAIWMRRWFARRRMDRLLVEK